MRVVGSAEIAKPKSKDGFRPDVEGARGLAVGAVLLFHAGLAGVVGGFIGVDVFFVISGFLITGLLLREHERTGRIAMLHFYARRARRLLPAALVVLVATLVAALNLVAPLDRPTVALDGAAAALSIGNIRFALAAGDYFTSVAIPSPFLHFWSLAVEEQFYLVWPALILLVARGTHARRRVMIALLGVFAVSFAANLYITDAAANWAFYSLPTRAWELGLGGLLAVGAAQIARIPGRIVGLAGWAGLAAIVFAALTFNSGLAWPGSAALLPAAGTALLLAGGPAPLGPGRLMAVAPLRFLGKISYSLYLVHWPIIVLAPFVLGGPVEGPAMAGLVGLAIAVAFLCWALIETPFRTGIPSLALRPGRTVSLGLAAITAVVVVAAGPYLGVIAPDTASAGDTAVATATDDPWIDAPVVTPAPVTPGATPITTPSATATPEPTAAPTATPIPDVANRGPLPADVRPALAKARSDEERLRDDGCLAFERVTTPPTCVYGDKNSSFTVALVGDSHAAAWFPALERIAAHEGWRIVTFVKVSCPFIDMRVNNTALAREYRECAAFNAATLARLKTLKPDLTLVAMSRIAIHPVSGADDNPQAKGAAVGRMIAQVPGRVALITDVPYAGVDVPGCLSAHTNKVEACTIPHNVAFTDSLGKLEKIAAAASGAGLIDMNSHICVGGGNCPVVVNDTIVFRDQGHLTATFSRSLAPALLAALEPIITASPAP